MENEIKKISESTKLLDLLYIEDDTEVQLSTLKILHSLFKSVTVAVDGRDGLSKFKKKEFDLILSDIHMPHMNGLQMLEEIRKEDTEIPIIFISAVTKKDYFVKAIELNSDYFIVKPMDIIEFTKALTKVVEHIGSTSYEKKLEEQLLGAESKVIEDVNGKKKDFTFNPFKYLNEKITKVVNS